MRPYILENRLATHPDKRHMTPHQRRSIAKKRRKEVRERRKADRKALKDEWGF